MLNPELNPEALAEQYRADGRVRIHHILDNESAAALRALLAEQVTYQLAYVANGMNLSMTLEQLAALTPEQRRDLFKGLYAEASRGVGFLYGRFHLSEISEGDYPQLAKLHEFYEFLNSDAMLSFVRKVTGSDDVISADAQATSYRPGHYLTRHRDDLSGQERRQAYVFGFSQGWHPDWGGLLQFFEDDGTPKDAWAPEFNTLSLFNVTHVHSVTHIAPYALVPRLSVTGWFRADELPGQVTANS